MNFGRAAHKLRRLREKDLKDVAVVLGVSTAYLAEMEKGHRKMSEERARQVAAAIDVPWSLMELAAKDPGDIENKSLEPYIDGLVDHLVAILNDLPCRAPARRPRKGVSK